MFLSKIGHVSTAFPNLAELQLGFNRLGVTPSISEADSSQFVTAEPPCFPNLRTLFLDGNDLGDWFTVVYAISSLPKYVEIHSQAPQPSLTSFNKLCLFRLQNLYLSSNGIKSIRMPVARSSSAGLPMTRLENIRRLTFDDNELSSWDDIDAIAGWCPNLQGLGFTGNPITNVEHSRELVVARIQSLETLDGSRVSVFPKGFFGVVWSFGSFSPFGV